MTTLNIIEPVGNLYLKYSGQCNPQPIELLLHGDGDCYFDEDAHIGNSWTDWRGTAISIQIAPRALRASTAMNFFSDHAELLQRLLDSYQEEINNGRCVGRWNEEIEAELERACEEIDEDEAWTASDYLFTGNDIEEYIEKAKELGLDILNNDSDSIKFSDKLDADAENDRVFVVDSMYLALQKELYDYRERLKEEEEYSRYDYETTWEDIKEILGE